MISEICSWWLPSVSFRLLASLPTSSPATARESAARQGIGGPAQIPFDIGERLQRIGRHAARQEIARRDPHTFQGPFCARDKIQLRIAQESRANPHRLIAI